MNSMRRLLLILFLSLTSYLVTSSLSVVLISLLLFFVGRQLVGFFQAKDYKNDTLSIFDISYMASFIYALMCFSFMNSNHYEYLQSFDGFNVYIPYTEELLNTDSLKSLIAEIYSVSKYIFVGLILIPFVYIGKLSSLFDGELYVTIQTIIILFASLVNVVVYNILVYNKTPPNKALLYTLLYAILSIHFYMSTFIVRDMSITLFYTLLIYFSFKPFTSKRLTLMILLVVLIGSIRLSSGIFASLYIFMVLFLSMKKGNVLKKALGFVFLSLVILFALNYIDIIQATFESKQLYYQKLEAEAGASTVAAFNVLPPGISHIVKAFYNQFMPIPSWRTMVETSFRPESYNIMNFPVIFATLFRYIMWFTIFVGLSSKKIRRYIFNNKVLVYNIFIALLFIAIQSDTMGHRRLLGVYPVFFLLSVLVYQNLNSKNKKMVLLIPSIVFILLQTIGLSNAL